MLRTSDIKQLYKGLVTNVTGTLVTTSAYRTQINRLIAYNSHTVAVILEIWTVDTGDTRGLKDQLFYVSLEPKETWVSPDMGMFVNADTDIDAVASVTSVVALRIEAVEMDSV